MSEVLHKVKSKTTGTSNTSKVVYFTVDQMIDAYQKGRRDESDELQKTVKNWINRNIRDTNRILNGTIEALKAAGLNCLNIYLRMESVYNFDVMILLEEDDLLDDRMTDIYNRVTQLEKEYNSETLEVTLQFTGKDEFFDETIVYSDGFVSAQKED